MSDPDGQSGRVDDHLVSNGLDLLPTLCDYAGVEPPEHCRGRSIRPLVVGDDPDWQSHLRIEGVSGEMRNHAGDNEAIVKDLHEELVAGSNLR